MGVISLAKELHLPYNLILEAMSKGFLFKGKEEFGRMWKDDIEFHKNCSKNPDLVLGQVCGFRDKEEIELIKHMIFNLNKSNIVSK